MSDEIRLELISKIEALRNKITTRHQTLNLEALWLFVATLSCWSVDVPYLRMVAIILVVVFLVFKVVGNKKSGQTFSQCLDDIKNEVDNSSLEEDAKKARFHELTEIKENLLSIQSIYKSTPIFLLGYAFWGLSFYYFLQDLFA